MAFPVTGPWSKVEYLNGSPFTYPNGQVSVSRVQQTVREWYRQAKPYDRPLPFKVHKTYVLSDFNNDTSGYPSFADAVINSWPFEQDAYDKAYSKAFNKAVSKLGDSSQWAVNLKEMNQAVDLIADPAKILWRFTRQLRRGNFRACADILGTQIPRGLRDNAKSFGNNWLKWHFGVEPLMADIHNGVKTLTGPLPQGRVKVKAEDVWEPKGIVLDSVSRADFKIRTGVTIGFDFRVENPNLYTASQLGLTNPLSFAWEIIPFSFVVDWFSNVGQVLGSFTSFAGVHRFNGYSSYLQVNVHRHYRVPSYPVQWNFTMLDVWGRRFDGLELPSLTSARWKAPSVTRAATAISLLLQQLR